MKKIVNLVIILVIGGVIAFFTLKSEGGFISNPVNQYASPHIFVLDKSTEKVIYEKNATKKAYPASLTKIMTALVALENIDDLDMIAPVDVHTYQEMVAENASMTGFIGREEVTYRDLLYGTILSSGGEAANSLAVHVAGSVEGFVQMMNDKAVELELYDSHFTNPEGLHNKKQFTTASDMAKLLNAALDSPHFREIFTQETYVTTSTMDHPNGILIESTVLSKLNNVTSNDVRIIGGKSGTTYEAGQCWVTLGVVYDREYIVVVMGAPIEDISNPNQDQIADTLNIFEKIKSNKY